MSMNLYWEPVDRDAHDLDDKLKYALRNRYGGTVDTIMNESDVRYLEGLLDAGIKDAQDIIDAIEKHGRVRVFER